MLRSRLFRPLALGCLLAITLGFATSGTASGSTDTALICSFNVLDPEHGSGWVWVEGGSAGCGNAEDFRLQLQWRNFLGGWTTKGTSNWMGNNTNGVAIFDCINGETETYRGKITRLDTGQVRYSEDTVRIRC